jgi:hypothetical protein
MFPALKTRDEPDPDDAPGVTTNSSNSDITEPEDETASPTLPGLGLTRLNIVTDAEDEQDDDGDGL